MLRSDLFTFPPSRAYRMAMPELAERYWTAEDVRALPDDGNRYECIDGVLLVTPAPRNVHQDVVAEFFRVLYDYIRPLRPIRLRFLPADIEIVPRTLVQPDLYVAVPKPGRVRLDTWDAIGSLMLAVEVLSPSTARVDRGRKREFYQRAGVAEYWIVDHEARLVERWRPEDTRPEVVRGTLVWQPRERPEPLVIDLEALFSEALDD